MNRGAQLLFVARPLNIRKIAFVSIQGAMWLPELAKGRIYMDNKSDPSVFKHVAPLKVSGYAFPASRRSSSPTP